MEKLSKILKRIANDLENISTAEGVFPGPEEGLKDLLDNEKILRHLIEAKRKSLQKKTKENLEGYYLQLAIVLDRALKKYSKEEIINFLENPEKKSLLNNLGMTHDFLLILR